MDFSNGLGELNYDPETAARGVWVKFAPGFEVRIAYAFRPAVMNELGPDIQRRLLGPNTQDQNQVVATMLPAIAEVYSRLVILDWRRVDGGAPVHFSSTTANAIFLDPSTGLAVFVIKHARDVALFQAPPADDITSPCAPQPSLALDRKKVEAGVRVPYRQDIVLRIASVESRAYRAAKAQALLTMTDARMAAGRTSDLTEDETREFFADLFSRHILLGWENIDDESGPVPYSVEQARTYLLDRDLDLYQFVNRACSRDSLFKVDD